MMQPASPHSMTAIPVCPAHGPILLIDDDELVAGSLRDYLAMRGFTVDVAPELAAAEALMRERHYSVIVVDPYLTGAVHSMSVSLIADIRFRQPHSSIIVLTGYGSRTLLEIASADRLTTVLFKPQSVTHLSEVIQRIPRSASESEVV
jgi:DNA-binding NtrC family response regulator